MCNWKLEANSELFNASSAFNTWRNWERGGMTNINCFFVVEHGSNFKTGDNTSVHILRMLCWLQQLRQKIKVGAKEKIKMNGTNNPECCRSSGECVGN